MKHLFILALLISTTTLAAWEEHPLSLFSNLAAGVQMSMLTIDADYRRAVPEYNFSIVSVAASFEVLQRHLSRQGVSFEKDETLRVVRVKIPLSEKERAYHLLDVLDNFEAFQPQQILAQMKAAVDSELAGFFTYQQQLAEQEARGWRHRMLPSDDILSSPYLMVNQ